MVPFLKAYTAWNVISVFSKSLGFSSQDRRVVRVTKLSFLDFRVIVGAPEDENVYQSRVGIDRPGAVYRCQTNPPFNCQQIPFDTSGKKHFSSWLTKEFQGIVYPYLTLAYF